jgi:hypothetical protein
MVDVKSSNRQGRYYTPAARIDQIAGVERTQLSGDCPYRCGDLYVGTAEDLERCGLVPRYCFPAHPSCMATWRPNGVKREDGESWHEVPGYMEVKRHPSGIYRVRLTVSRDEQARRQFAWKECERAKRAEWEAENEKSCPWWRPKSQQQTEPALPEKPAGRGHLQLVWSAPS